MNTSWTKLGLGVFAVTALAGGAAAQKPSNAERGLVGVNLYDSGVKVVSLYGSPDAIEAVSITSGAQSGGGGGRGGFGGPGFGGPGGGRGGAPSGPPGGGAAGADRISPFDFGDTLLRQGRGPSPQSGGSPAGGGRLAPPGGGAPPPGGAPGFPGGAPGGGSPAGNGQTEVTQYTRWVYNRGGSKYGFIVDNQGRVVQIEAIGLQNNRVKTRKGVGFGATFAQLIKSYGNPDGYEVGGDTILVKYLVNKKVAFRLTRLQAKKPHVVTGIVVSAGKV